MRDYITTIRNLLNKADSLPETNPEHETFKTKAYRLMVKHGIDNIMLMDGKEEDEIIDRVLQFDNPYAVSKADLYVVIALAHRCKVIKLRGYDKKYHVFGYRSDVESTEVLYTMLLLNAESVMINARKPANVSSKTFNTSWWAGYAYEISNRLRKAEKEVNNDLEPGTAIVLRDRKIAAEAAMHVVYPKTTKGQGKSVRSSEGFYSGSAAGKNASFGNSSVTSNVTRRAIS